MRHRTERLRLVLALALVFATASMGLLVSAAPSRADHDTITWTPATLVAGSTGFFDSYPVSVADTHGHVYVFYYTYNTGTGSANINVTKYQTVGSGGNPLWLFDEQVNSVANVVDNGLPFAATVDHSGNVYVAWSRITGFGRQISVSKSTDGAVTWAPAVQASATGGDAYWPVLTTTPSGAVYVGYDQLWGSTYSLAVAKSTDGGASFGTPVNVTTPSYLWSASIASDAGGRVYLAYGGQATSGAAFSVSVYRSDDGITWSAPAVVSSSLYTSFFPALYADTTGNVHISWFSSEGSDYAMRYGQSSDRGVTWSGGIPIIGTGFSGGYVGYMAGEGDTVMYAYGSYANSVAFAVSGDHGGSWYPSSTVSIGTSTYVSISADQNDTIWAVYGASNNIYAIRWAGPPSAPVVTTVTASGSSGLTVQWTPSPEKNVEQYRVYRSADGSNYVIVGVVPGSATSYTDSGLADGTYFYRVDAVNSDGTVSHLSGAASGTVGPTTQDLINQLESEITALQDQLAAANASSSAEIAALQSQVSSLQTQLTSLQNSQASSNSATAAALAQLQANLTQLQQRLSDLQTQQATQTISYANLAFEIIVVVLLVVLLLNQMRRPKAPQMMMAQPAQAQQKSLEDEL